MNFTLYFLIIFCILSGPVLASFFTAGVMRQAGLTKAQGDRSKCDNCQHQLRWFELIPVVSYLFLRGKCRYCGHKISRKVFLTELAGLVLYSLLSLWIWEMASTQQALDLELLVTIGISYVFLSTLFYLGIYDLFTYSLPTGVTLLLVGEALVANGAVIITRLFSHTAFADVALGNLDNLLLGVTGYLLFFIIIKFTKQKAMGVGDMYLACACGLMLGWPNSASWFYVMLFSATIVGLGMAAFRKKFKNLLLPLVPFMTFGYIAALVWGPKIFQFLFPKI